MGDEPVARAKRGRFMDRFTALQGPIAVAAAIVTATVAIVGWSFRSSVVAVQAAQQELEAVVEAADKELKAVNAVQDHELDVQGETLIGVRKDVEHSNKLLDWLVRQKLREAQADGVSVEPTPRPSPRPRPTP